MTCLKNTFCSLVILSIFTRNLTKEQLIEKIELFPNPHKKRFKHFAWFRWDTHFIQFVIDQFYNNMESAIF